jgi:hypothetical protein
VKLNADHHGVCRFGKGQDSEDILEIVVANVGDLYKQGIAVGELHTLQSVNAPEGSTDRDGDLTSRLANLGEPIRELSCSGLGMFELKMFQLSDLPVVKFGC